MNKMINTLNTKEHAYVLRTLKGNTSAARKELVLKQALTKLKVLNAQQEAKEFMAWYKSVS